MGRPRKGSAPLPPEPPSSKLTRSASTPPFNSTGGGRKRGRKLSAVLESKKIKLDFRHSRGYGQVLTVGQGDTGQLGRGRQSFKEFFYSPATRAMQNRSLSKLAGNHKKSVDVFRNKGFSCKLC